MFIFVPAMTPATSLFLFNVAHLSSFLLLLFSKRKQFFVSLSKALFEEMFLVTDRTARDFKKDSAGLECNNVIEHE